jgi:tRNA (cmo5U34)-methyltransferase
MDKNMNTTLDFFEYQARMYDAYQHTCVPKYAEALTVCTELLAYTLRGESAPRLLDAGCGTGNLTLKVLEAVPTSSVACLDGSREMLQAAKQKLDAENVTFHCFDLENEPWDRQWETETFDAIYSAFVLEHLPFDAYKQFLTAAKRVLKPGGMLAVAEGFAGETNLNMLYERMRQLEELAVKTGVFAGEVMDEMKRISKERERHYFATKDDKKQWWNDAGFVDTDFHWQYYCLAVLAGRKPAGA